MAADFAVRPSSIQGQGLFARRNFNKGERLLAYAGITSTVRPVQASASSPIYVLEIRPGLWLDGSSHANITRHANHSCAPNAELVFIDETTGAWLIAQENIPADAEITFDYGFNLAESLFQPCRCGQPDCIGYIIAAPRRASLRRHLRFSRPRD
jgi:SET domain-containing protein